MNISKRLLRRLIKESISKQLKRLIKETAMASFPGDGHLSADEAETLAALASDARSEEQYEDENKGSSSSKAVMNKDDIPQTLKKLPGGWFNWEGKIKDMVLLGEKEEDLVYYKKKYPSTPFEWEHLESEVKELKTLKNQYFPDWSEHDLDELYRQGTVNPKYAPDGYSILAGDLHRHDY